MTDYDKWIPLPKPGERCIHSGLKRGMLLKLPERSGGKIRISDLRETGAKRGIKVIHLGDLLSYLEQRAKDKDNDEDMMS